MPLTIQRETVVRSALPSGTIGFVATMMGSLITLTTLDQWLRIVGAALGIAIGLVTLADVVMVFAEKIRRRKR